MNTHIFDEIYNYIGHIVDISVHEERNIIIWGCGYSGAFIKHLIEDIDGRKNVDYYIDKNLFIFGKSNIYRPSLLWYLNSDKNIVLNSARDDGSILKICEENGYTAGKYYFDVRSDIGDGYWSFLENRYNGINFKEETEDYVYKSSENGVYQPVSSSTADEVFAVIDRLDIEHTFFDYGCEKGNMLLMAALHRCSRIGGIDINKECINMCKGNLARLDVKADIFCADAAQSDNIDEYSIFYFYNPFNAEVMIPALHHIEDSKKNNSREIRVIYVNPFCHNQIMSETKFKLSGHIKVDNYDPIANIYTL